MRTGLSKSRLERFHDVLHGYVERNEIPGLVALVSRHDDVHVEVLGKMAIGHSAPMTRDAIFRIASITKPVTAVAAMILVEDSKIRLDEPVDAWLPELANRRVLRSLSSPLDDTVPAKRAITVRDLMTSTMGIGSVMAMPDTYPIQKAIRELRIGGDGPKLQSQWPPMDEWLRNLGTLPLIAQPGERWMYNVSSDALGALVARVSGKSLGAFMQERIFEPLAMKDTSFRLPAEKIDRLPGFYVFNRETNAFDVFDPIADSTWLAEPPFESGAGGLLSTVDDYFAFSRMLLNGGVPILSRASVELMTSDQVTPAQREGMEIFFEKHSSWGFGMAVDIARYEIFHSPGRFGWTGGFGTIAYIDPAEHLITILFTQRMIDSPEPAKLFVDFFTQAYAAASS